MGNRERVVSAMGLGKLRGSLDGVSEHQIEGWARDEDGPNKPVQLQVLDNGLLIGTVSADLYREDLALAGIGDGRHAFRFTIPGGLSPRFRHVIQVRREADWRDLPNSPKSIDAADTGEPVPVTSVPVLRDDALVGNLDQISRDMIDGWASDNNAGDEPVRLQVLDNGVEIAEILANRYRQDLEAAGVGDGRRAFRLDIPGGLSPMSRHIIQVKRASDGADIPGSPALIEAAGTFDTMLQRTFANAIAALETGEEQLGALSFLTGQLDRLFAIRADADGRASKRRAYKQFRRRWGPEAAAMKDVQDPGLRALVVDVRTPQLTRDAGSHALLSHMRALQTLGYEVNFVASDEMRDSRAISDGLTEAGFVGHSWPFYTSLEDVLRSQPDCFDVVYLHRPEIASRYMALARRHNPRARILYSMADLHHVRIRRQADVEERPELRALSNRLRLEECTAAWLSDAVITHSPEETAAMRKAVPTANVSTVRWEVPIRPTQVPFGLRRDIAFVGGYAHAPNTDAAYWLVEAVMPLVWKVEPKIQCLLVGSDMPDSVRNLERDGVVVVGYAEDLGAEVFDKVRLTVAPLRFGAGIKGKVLESFARGIPCIMSDIASEGMPLSAPLQCLIGKDEAALAALILHLHSNQPANRLAAEAGLEMIGEHFSQEATLSALEQVLLT